MCTIKFYEVLNDEILDAIKTVPTKIIPKSVLQKFS